MSRYLFIGSHVDDNELSAGGEVIMPLQDMFFGAYFGQLKDKYGINWMLTFQPAE